MREENVAVPLTELLKGFLQGIVFKQREWRGCIPSRIDHGIQDGNNIIRVRWKLHFPALAAGTQIGRFFAVNRCKKICGKAVLNHVVFAAAVVFCIHYFFSSNI